MPLSAALMPVEFCFFTGYASPTDLINGSLPMTAMYDFDSHAIQGSRDSQEDSCAFHILESVLAPEAVAGDNANDDQQELIAVLADGMGGHVGGSTASNLACSQFIASYCRDGAEDKFTESLEACNEAISARISQDKALKGMGCTLIGASIRKQGLRWVSVGDSLLYLYRDRELFRLNQDHSFGALLDAMVKKGEMSADEAAVDPRRNSLLSAVSGEELDMIDIHDIDIPLDHDDWIILASDGLLTLNKKLIANIIHMNERGGASGVAKALTQAVQDVQAPNQDNTTVMVARPGPGMQFEV